MASVQTVSPRAVARNEPCPCGSGKRYKDCHGSLRDSTAAQPRILRTSRYRPEGGDWAQIAEDEQDRLGALMELALKHQVEQRPREAERIYRAVLEQAPHTHDALHMLGVVRLGLGDYTEAERLIRRAMRLRPSYPAIETNWALVRRTIAARDRRGIERLSEAALPLLFESLRVMRENRPRLARDPRAPLHIVPCLGELADASMLVRRLQMLLAPMQPEAWHRSDPRKIENGWQPFDLHTLDPRTGRRPRGGDVVLIGLEGDADWLREPIDRVLIFVLSTTPSLYLERLRRIAADGARSIALVFESRAKAKRFGQTGFVLPPFVDITPFATTERSASSQPARLRISAVGQDGRRVVATDDLSVLKAVAEGPDELQLLDPGPLRYEFGTTTTVNCIARSELSLATLLGTVHVHLHRPLPWWAESDGEGVFGPMAAGVPVLCPRDSIYAEYIDDGVDGWLYDDARSAAAKLAALRNDREALAAAGRSAREKAVRLFDPGVLREAYVDVVRRWREST